jgi:hypothetical protein
MHLWLQQAAAQRGQTVAAFARQQVMEAFRMSTTRAWSCPIDRSDPSVVLAQGFRPSYLLLHLGESQAGHRCFGLLHAAPDREGVPLSDAYWRDTMIFQNPRSQRFVLEGSPFRWRLANSFFDAGRRLVVVELAAEEETPDTFEEWNRYLEQRTLGLLMTAHSGPDPVAPTLAAELERLLELFNIHAGDSDLPPEKSPRAPGLPAPRPGSILSKVVAEQLLARTLAGLRHLEAR